MPTGIPTPVTPAQIAAFGHIAAQLRAFMEERRLKPGDMNEQLGVKRTNTAIYAWLAGRAAPGPKPRAKLAKILGVKSTQLLERAPGAEPVEIERPIVPPPAPRPAVQRQPDPLQFNVQSDGDARLRLDITLPYERCVPILRMLLDAGLVISQQAGD